MCFMCQTQEDVDRHKADDELVKKVLQQAYIYLGESYHKRPCASSAGASIDGKMYYPCSCGLSMLRVDIKKALKRPLDKYDEEIVAEQQLLDKIAKKP